MHKLALKLQKKEKQLQTLGLRELMVRAYRLSDYKGKSLSQILGTLVLYLTSQPP